MAYTIACGEVMPGCAPTFRAETREELMEQVVAHAGEDHGITEVTPEVAAAVEGAITEG